MREIKASTKATGSRRERSVEAARRKVKDGELYFIRRHNAFFRPRACGYTTHLPHAALYTAETARAYLDVEGLSVVPLTSMRDEIARMADDSAADAATLRAMLRNSADLVSAPST